eukprot:CFRG1237T1
MSDVEVSLPTEVEDLIVDFDTNVSDLIAHLEPLLSANTEELQAKLTPEERAQLELAVAYATSSMFWMYLTTTGVDARTHPIKAELDRVKSYMARLKHATLPKNTSKLDKEAANRFIRGGLADADTDVKEKLTAQIEKANEQKKSSLKRSKESEVTAKDADSTATPMDVDEGNDDSVSNKKRASKQSGKKSKKKSKKTSK